MSAGNNAASSPRGGGAAARSEGKAKTVNWRGLRFQIPGTLPATLLWDIEEAQESPIGLVRALLGDEQTQRVREKFAEDEVPLEEGADALAEIVEKILEKHGLDSGKSPASQRS